MLLNRPLFKNANVNIKMCIFMCKCVYMTLQNDKDFKIRSHLLTYVKILMYNNIIFFNFFNYTIYLSIYIIINININL